MLSFLRTQAPVRLRGAIKVAGLLVSLLLVNLIALLAPVGASGAVTVFGSPLAVPATLNTAENLNYAGTNTPVPPAPDAPNGIFHTFHYGADTALWNVASAVGSPSVPASGQALKVSLEGCAEPAAGGPVPLTQIHFQDLTPLRNGGARVNLSSQPLGIPVCGQNGATQSTVSTYEPTNLCVKQGDYVAFNDNGGYVPGVYRAGVPYEVLGSVMGSTTDSFIRNNGTGNGSVLSANFQNANEGFASNAGEELLMQVTLATGPDANHNCIGGSAGLPPPPPPLPPIRVGPQTDGVNVQRVVAVAVYCRHSPVCKGVVRLTVAGRRVSVGSGAFKVPAGTTSHVSIRLRKALIGAIRSHNGVSATLTAVVESQTFTQTIGIRIF